MAVHTRLLKKEIFKILDGYNIGKLVGFNGIKEGIENTNYKILTTKGIYILTVFEERVNESNLPFFLKLMLNSKKKKISCPRPIKDLKGNFINDFNLKKFSIFSFLNGKSKKNWSSKDCFVVGKTLANFHLINKSFSIKAKNDFGLNFWLEYLKKNKNHNFEKIKPGISNFLKNEINFIKKNWPRRLPMGIIHADFFPDNVFFKGNKISGILDFYFSCYDFLIYDLAIAINAWCFKNGNYNKEFFNNLIDGYQSKRILSSKEKKNLNIMLRGASIRFLITRLLDSIKSKEGNFLKKKNPIEFYNILLFHIQTKKENNYFN